MSDQRREIVAETLRFLASGWVQDHPDRKWLVEVADEMERNPPVDWMCCPLCAEADCDDDCPLRPVREASSDHPTTRAPQTPNRWRVEADANAGDDEEERIVLANDDLPEQRILVIWPADDDPSVHLVAADGTPWADWTPG